MDFAYSARTEELRARVQNFMDEHIVPRIRQYNEEVQAGNYHLSFMADLRELAKSEGLWNMFLPHLLPILHGANIPLTVRKFRVAPAYSAVSPNIKEQFDV